MKKIYSFAFASLAVFSFLFLSCDFFNPAESGKEVSGAFTLSGSLVTDINQNADAFPSGFLNASCLDSAASSSREAFPSYVTDALYYSVSCSNGTSTYEGKVDSSDPSNITFTVDVPSGSSTVTAKAFIDEAKTKQVYEGTLLLQDVKEDSDLSGRTIELSDIHSGTEKTATVSLPISIQSGTKISKISASIMKDNASFGSGPLSVPVSEGKTYYFSFSDNGSGQFSETQATEANSVPGVYDVEFSFFAGDSASSSGEYLAFWTKQKIIASNYLDTKNWNGNGVDSCINPDNSNILEVTEKICLAFLSDTFYIDSRSGSDSGSGSFSSPFKTIQKAVNVIQSLGKTEACTVFLKGDITADQDSDCIDGSFVKIEDSANLKLNIKTYPSGSTFSVNANGRGRVLYVGSGNNVSLKNVTLENGNANNSNSQGGTNGGAAYVGGNGTLSLENCAVSSCVAEGNGGAIYVGGNGSNLELTNCVIGKENDQISALKEGVQNTTYAPDSVSNSNYAKGSGGGIYGEDNANIQILSTKIVNCYSGGSDSSSGGGGIFLDSAVCKIDDTLSDNNYQSEIYANGSANARGVGIYAGNSSALTLGGSVHHNYTDVLAGVPGIYLNDGSTLNLKEHSEIRDNYSKQSAAGSGIFVSGNNCSVNLQGGTVENNSSLNGSYFATDIGYTSSITDAVINISGSSYIGSISSQSAPIKISGNITGFSGDKICKIYTQITEDKTVLQATSENVNLSSFADYFKLYDLDTRTEATDYKLSVDSSVSPQVAKIVKENSSQGGNSGSESQTLTYLYENKNSVSITSGAEYTVSSELELFYLSSLVNDDNFTFENATVKQTSDITLSTYSNWTPIGTSSAFPFSGTFDGQNNKITGLAIEATESHRALFGYTSDANLKNINISGTITASGVTLQYIAGVVGEFTQKTGTTLSEITNCTSSVSISFTGGSSDLVGGIAGKIAADDTIKITNCAFNGTISASGMSKIGGIAGEASYNVIFYNCENSGTIYASGNAGGIFGYGQANKNGTQYEFPSVKNCVCNVALSNISVRTSGGLIGNYSETGIADAFADYSYYMTSSTSDYQSIGTTTYTDKATVFEFSSDGTKGTLSGGTQDVGSKTDLKDVVEALNAWITESTLGNDSSFATYKQWSYNSSGLPTIISQ